MSLATGTEPILCFWCDRPTQPTDDPDVGLCLDCGRCPAHGPMTLVCGEYRCGRCYEEDLLTNTHRPKRPDDDLSFGLVPDGKGHGLRLGTIGDHR